MLTIVLLYIDDMILVSNYASTIAELKHMLSTHFMMKDLGDLRHFLGLEVMKLGKGIFISMRKYVLYLLG